MDSLCDTSGPATIPMGCNGTPDKVSGFVSCEYDSGIYINEVDLKDETLLLEEIVADGTFLDIRPQGMFSCFLSQAGVSKKKFSSISCLIRKMLPIRKQNVVQVIHMVNAAWEFKISFFFSGGTFYWGEGGAEQGLYFMSMG